MKDIVEGLENKTIISYDNIVLLKDYIAKKYPNNDTRQNSLVFADCVNKILDKNMQQFSEECRQNIKKNIIKNAVNRKNFTVNAYDIFNECINIDLKNDEFVDNLLSWINNNQVYNIGKERLLGIIEDVKKPDIVLNLEYQKEKVEQVDNTNDLKFDGNSCDTEGEINTIYIKHNIFKKYKTLLLVLFTLISIFIMIQGSMISKNKNSMIENVVNYIFGDKGTLKQEVISTSLSEKSVYENNLEKHLKYVDIDSEKLRKWLRDRNSLLAEEPYLSTILKVGKKYNINPLLLIAITGQEQGFVPKNNKYAKKIVNNPYNVYVSWKEYNTNIEDSTEIAARTLINLSKDKPENADSIKWINKRYAEDNNWWMGVSKIFNRLNDDI